jgi:hypothetical protein
MQISSLLLVVPVFEAAAPPVVRQELARELPRELDLLVKARYLLGGQRCDRRVGLLRRLRPDLDGRGFQITSNRGSPTISGDASALSDNAVVAEAREVEHIREVGQYFVSKERRARMCAAPGKMIESGSRYARSL